jgi:hypothetical protein
VISLLAAVPHLQGLGVSCFHLRLAFAREVMGILVGLPVEELVERFFLKLGCREAEFLAVALL